MSLMKAFVSAGLVSQEKTIGTESKKSDTELLQEKLKHYYFRCKPIQEFLCEYEHILVKQKPLTPKELSMLKALRKFYFDIGEEHLIRNINYHINRILDKQSNKNRKEPTDQQKLIWTIRACGYALLDVLSDPNPRHFSEQLRKRVMEWIESEKDNLGIH